LVFEGDDLSRLLWTIVLAAAATTAAYGTKSTSPYDAVEFLATARASNGLASNGIQPWHLRVHFETFDVNGQNPVEGVFEEWWAGPLQSKRKFAKAGSNYVEFVTETGIYGQGGPKPVDSPELAILWTLIDPIPEKEMIQDLKLTETSVSVGGSPMTCIALNRPPEDKSSKAPDTSPKFCFQADKPMLRVSSPDGASRQVTYNHIFFFQQRYIAGEVHYSLNGKLVLKANVEMLENLDRVDADMFTPPPDARKVAVRRLALDERVVARYRIKVAGQEYIWEDNPFKLEGTVAIDARIGLNGHLEQAEVKSGPPPLRAPATDLLRHNVYRPIAVNGDPVEVEFVFYTIFHHSVVSVPSTRIR
jgi:hypothetical protein